MPGGYLGEEGSTEPRPRPLQWAKGSGGTVGQVWLLRIPYSQPGKVKRMVMGLGFMA